MSVEDFIIAVFCIIDDELKKTLKSTKLRKRGRKPGLDYPCIIVFEDGNHVEYSIVQIPGD
jgi:hypothetical protein